MSESSPEVETPEEPEAESAAEPQKESRKVPVEALGKERAEKRAARERAERLEQELAELRKQIPNLDMDKLASALAEHTEKVAASAAQAQVAPLQAEVSKWKTMAQKGLTEDQVAALQEFRRDNPNLTEDQALLLTRMSKPDLFPGEPPFDPRVHGGAPVTGQSPYRAASDKPDYVKLSNEARANKDNRAMMEYAKQGFLEVIKSAYRRSR